MKTKIFIIVICSQLICNLLIAQNITNTLGTSGLFTIKDGSTIYLTLNQSTGQVNILKTLRLENTTSSTAGILFKGPDRFLHNYGAGNTFLGINSGNFSMTGSLNTALGMQSLFTNTTGIQNTSVGYLSLYANTTGSQNTALGGYSLYSNTTGGQNTALGMQSLFTNTTGIQNTSVGYLSLYANTTGYQNTAVGHHSLLNNTTGNYNTAVGYNSGSTITTGLNLTCIGIDAAPSTPTAIDQITLGNIFVSSLRCNVTTITSLSDARDKKNIKDLSLGLDFITKLKPRQFNWDKREWYDDNVSDGSKMKESPTAGFIAQELDEAQTTENAEWLNLVLKDNPEKWEATPGNLLPIVVKAIQDLKAENDEIKAESEKLKVESVEMKNENEEMKQLLLKLEQTQNILVIEIEKLKEKDEMLKQVRHDEEAKLSEK